jgi:hypothetical protein
MTSKRVVWWIEQEIRGWSLILMARERQPASVRCPRAKNSPQPLAGWMTSVPPFYRGRKRGQVVRTRTVISQAHSFQWLGSFGNRGNGRYRTELCQAHASITRYLTAYQLPQERALLRLDGQYGTGTVLADLAGFAYVTRGKDDTVLDHPLVQARLHLPADQFQQRPESQIVRSLYDWTAGAGRTPGRAVPRGRGHSPKPSKKKSPVGVTRAGIVYELFFTCLREPGVHCLRCRRGVFASRRLRAYSGR